MSDLVRYQKWYGIAVLYFFIASLLGCLMRIAFVIDLPEWIDYRNITHTHSHLAMMGWIYLGLFIFIVSTFKFTGKQYRILFMLSAVSVAGMLFSFPLQGYAGFSITFTSIHLILSYIFAFYIIRASLQAKSTKKSYSSLFLRTALIFLVISSVGTWMLGVFMAIGMKGTALYYGSVQFFLHFQFNGWFIFAVLALFIKILENKGIVYDKRIIKIFYYLLVISCFLTFALAVSWSTPDKLLFWTNSLGVIIQTFAIVYFVKFVNSIRSEIKNTFHKSAYALWTISLFFFVAKIAIQSLVAIPYLATISYTIKNFVIGFIHLLMLGAISTFLIGMSHYTFSHFSKLSKLGVQIFMVGFAVTELLLFLQGIMFWSQIGFLPYYHVVIFSFSGFMATGILLHLISIIKLKLTDNSAKQSV